MKEIHLNKKYKVEEIGEALRKREIIVYAHDKKMISNNKLRKFIRQERDKTKEHIVFYRNIEGKILVTSV